MSIICITGVPSSGKTYFAASKIKEVYDKKSRPIYTNVNLKVPFDDYLFRLDVKKLYDFARSELKLFEYFTRLSRRYEDSHNVIPLLDEKQEDDKEDELFKKEFDKDNVKPYLGNYDKYLKDSGLLKDFGDSYIVWDECQNDLMDEMGKADPVWIRFFSYHRHFGLDIVLITQDISLIHRKYKPFISKFYFGQNPAKRLTSKTLRFKVYTDHRQFEKFYIETISLPMKKEIFDFYDSGEYKVEKSVLFKKLALPVLLIIGIVSAYFIFFGSSNASQPKAIENNISNIQHINNKFNQSDLEDDREKLESSSKFMFFNCNLEDCTAYNSSFSIPFNAFKNFCDSVEADILSVSKISDYYSKVLVSFPPDVYESIKEFEFNNRSGKNERSSFQMSNGVFIPNK